MWKYVQKNSADRKAGMTKKRYKGLDQTPKFVSPTMQYTYERDYTFKSEQQVSLGTLEGRITLSYQGYAPHLALIQHGAHVGDAKLWYDQAKKHFYLLVSLELERTDPTLESHKQVIGVDVGIRYLAVTAASTGQTSFYTGKRVRQQANHYARLRKRLQQKGTRWAKRRVRRMAQRERRLQQQTNHVVSKHIVRTYPQYLIGLSQLSAIRERTNRRPRRHKKNGKGTTPVSPTAPTTHSTILPTTTPMHHHMMS